MISKETIDSVISLREKIADPGKRAECITEVENMIKMKESHMERADWGTCCGNICNLVPQIESELQMLQKILETLNRKESKKAASLLEDYIAFLQKNYSPEPEH